MRRSLLWKATAVLLIWLLFAAAAVPAGAAIAQLQLVPADTMNANEQFGYAVAISEDGNTAIVGAPNKEIDGNLYAGAAYIFVRSGSKWVQQARLTNGLAREGFGFAVGISGERVIVGTDGSKAAYVFARSGTNWTKQNMRFDELTVWTSSWWYGSSVAISGNLAIVGDYKWEGSSGSERGAVHFYEFVGDEWLTSSQNVLIGTHNYEWYGYSVAASAAHSLAGGPYESVGNSYPGGAWAYPGGARLWQDPSSDSSWFGNSVALSSDGETAVVGAPYEDPNHVGGAIYVFSETPPFGWSQQARLTIPGGGYHDAFGYSCAISTGKIVAGAPDQDGGRGVVYFFTGGGAGWAQKEAIYASQKQESDSFGYSVGIAAGTVIIGAPEINQSRSGKVYIYETPAPPPTYTLRLAMDGGQPHLGFQSAPGRYYRLERSTTLQPDSWIAVVDNIAGTGVPLEVIDSNPVATAAFYRLVVLP